MAFQYGAFQQGAFQQVTPPSTDAFQAGAFQFGAFQTSATDLPPVVVVPAASTGGAGGGGRTAKVDRWDADELEAIYDRILGIEKPPPVIAKAIKAVERVSDEIRPDPIRVDWDAVAADLRAVKALAAAYQAQLIEDDDEDAIAAVFVLMELQ